MDIKLITADNNKFYDITNICADEIILTSTVCSPASNLSFGIYSKNLEFNISEGTEVLFYAEGKAVFKGYVFQIQRTKQIIKIIAYDQTRYLKNRDSFYFRNVKASEIIMNVCSKFKINIGEIDNTEYIIPILIEDDTALWNVFEKALNITQGVTNQKYIIYDDFGKLMLKNVKNMSVPLFFSSDDKTMIDFNYKTDIDSETFNRVKLFKHNKDDKVCYTAAEEQAESVARWGVLQYTKVIDDELNSAQANELAKKILEAKNKLNSALSVVDFGKIDIRAGSSVGVKIKLAQGEINSLFYVRECVHSFKNDQHTMKLELGDI